MKKVLMILAVVLIVLAILCGIVFWYVRTYMVLDGPGMTYRADSFGPENLTGLHWSFSTSYQEGCFAFSVYPDEKDIFRLSGFCWSESKRKLVDFEEKKMSAESVVRLRNLLSEALLSGEIEIPPEPDPDEEVIIALDEPSGIFELTFADERGTVKYASPGGTLRDELFTLLACEAGAVK